MTLKEAIRDSIEELDNDSLASLYEHILKLKERAQQDTGPAAEAPSLSEVLELTAAAPGSWSADVIAARAHRA